VVLKLLKEIEALSYSGGDLESREQKIALIYEVLDLPELYEILLQSIIEGRTLYQQSVVTSGSIRDSIDEPLKTSSVPSQSQTVDDDILEYLKLEQSRRF
jgi:hypothetical protein